MSTAQPVVPTGLADVAVHGVRRPHREVVAAGAQAAATCWCDRPSRGLVDDGGVAGMHECHECSPEHCWHAREARRCQFGACTLDAAADLPGVVDVVTGQAMRVCTLHVGPALSWGRPEPVSELVVHWLDQPPHQGRGAAA